MKSECSVTDNRGAVWYSCRIKILSACITDKEKFRLRKDGKMVVRRNSTTERLVFHPWGPHTHQLWQERRKRRKAKINDCSPDRNGGRIRYSKINYSNDTIENDSHVILFVGGMQSRDRDPVRWNWQWRIQNYFCLLQILYSAQYHSSSNIESASESHSSF